MKVYNIGKYTFVATPYSAKKYAVYKKNKYITSFGGIRSNGVPYDQFEDKIGFYKKYNHKDRERKKNYYARHGKKAEFESPKWFSHRYLW